MAPALPTREPQPVIYDPVLDITFPYELTNPDNIPESSDEVFYPVPKGNLNSHQKHALIEDVKANVSAIIKSGGSETRCSKCKRALAAAKPAALYAPLLVPDALINMCKTFGFQSEEACEEKYAPQASGAIWAQVLAYADLEGLDGQYICHYLKNDFCEQTQTRDLDTSKLFPKPKPAQVQVPKASGERVKVLHMSDFHLDARYAVSAEADCTGGLCCRTDKHHDGSEDHVVLPASAYGAFRCDTPYDLGLAALQAVGPLTGTGKGCKQESLAWTLYTGDLVSHDPESQMSREYVEYTETSIFHMFKKYLTGPVFAALGNHDSSPENIDAPHSLPGRLGEQFSWNYRHLAGLWQHEGWISNKTAEEARTHYGGYSIKTHFGLRVISFNTGRLLIRFTGIHWRANPCKRLLVPFQPPQHDQHHQPRQFRHLLLDDRGAPESRGHQRARLAGRSRPKWLGWQQSNPRPNQPFLPNRGPLFPARHRQHLLRPQPRRPVHGLLRQQRDPSKREHRPDDGLDWT